MPSFSRDAVRVVPTQEQRCLPYGAAQPNAKSRQREPLRAPLRATSRHADRGAGARSEGDVSVACVRTRPTGAAPPAGRVTLPSTAPQRPASGSSTEQPRAQAPVEVVSSCWEANALRGEAPFQTRRFTCVRLYFTTQPGCQLLDCRAAAAECLRAGSGCRLRVHLRARGGLKEPFMLFSGLGDNNGAAV